MTVDGHLLGQLKLLKYLGATITKDARSEKEVRIHERVKPQVHLTNKHNLGRSKRLQTIKKAKAVESTCDANPSLRL